MVSLMRRKISVFGLGILVVIIFGIAAWHVHRVYYFNPFTFKKDDVTTLSWNDYKNPMELSIVYQPGNGPQTSYETENRSEINYVLSELRKATPKSYHPVDLPSGQIWIQFRNPISGHSYIVAILRNHMKVDLLSQKNPMTVTSGLRNFIEQKKSSAKTS